jgi:hypothetical protein
MISRLTVIGSMAALLAAAVPATADETFKARLSGEQEVPPVTDQGTSGKFEIQFNRDFTEGEFTLRVDAGLRITQAHLHCAVAGANGPIIIWLAGIPPQTCTAPACNNPLSVNAWDVDGKWVSSTTVTNANIVNTACGSTLREIADAMNDGRVYANVHSVAKPGGVARGQIESNHH